MNRTRKYRFWLKNEMQGILELKPGGTMDMAWEWDSVDDFTGLRDKNGKEIYEGDAVRLYGQEYMGNAEVVFAHGVYRVYFDRWFVISVDIGSGQLEVIGNIYENPTSGFTIK